MKPVLLATILALAFPGAGQAGLVTMTSQDVPLGSRALQSEPAQTPFNMLGVHWQGSGSVAYRTRTAAGRWGAWSTTDDDSGPDAASSERSRRWRDGGLDWVGASVEAQFRTTGAVSRLRAYYLESRTARAAGAVRASRSLASAGEPAIAPRSAWQADEKITRAKPDYAPELKLAIVHHTANSNSYTPAEAAAIVRGIEIYHVQGNGWNDIGYNFLIDRYGTIYEGRAGGITRNVIGAHAEGFNTGSVGVALIGNFQTATPPPAMQAALVKLLAWRLDVAHIDPLSTVAFRSGGNLKFRAGRTVVLRAISGHRDTGPTECPGRGAYRLLPSLAEQVSRTGLPKLYAPLVSGSLGGDVRFQARLSSSLHWTVSVAGPTGTVVATHSGNGSTVDWTWRSAGVAPGRYRWSIGAGPAVLPALGALGTPTPAPQPAPTPVTPKPTVAPAAAPVSALTARPRAVNPAPDGTGGVVTVGFTLPAPASVTVSIRAVAHGSAPAQSLLSASLPAGANSFEWNLADLPDGRYRFVVSSQTSGSKAVSRQVGLVVDRTLTGLTASPAAVSPNRDGASDTTTIGFSLATRAAVTVRIDQLGRVVASLSAGDLGRGLHAVVWNGTVAGVAVPDGAYSAVVTVTDALGAVSFSTPLTIDTTPPVLTLLDPGTLLFQLSEPATVTVTLDGVTSVVLEPSGTFTIPWQGGAVSSITAQADDLAGNLSAVVSSPPAAPG